MTDDIEHLSPLVKWSGGKKTEIAIFKKYFPSPNRYDTYIECFVGGGAVFFYLNPQNAIINDIHPELVTSYRDRKRKRSKYPRFLWRNIKTMRLHIIKSR